MDKKEKILRKIDDILMPVLMIVGILAAIVGAFLLMYGVWIGAF